MILKRRHCWVNSRRRSPWVTRVAYNVETGTVLFCKHAGEESQISGIEDGRAPVFDMGAVWGSSGASTGTACLGKSVKGNGEGRGGEGEGCRRVCVGGRMRGAPPPGVCGSPCRSLAAGTPPPPPGSSSFPSSSSPPSRGRGSQRPVGPPRTCPPCPGQSTASVWEGTSPGR